MTPTPHPQATRSSRRHPRQGRSAARLALVPLLVIWGLTACTASVDPADDPRLGRLAVAIDGLPDGATANVSVTGPNGYATSITKATTLTGLEPGEYEVTAAAAAAPNATFTVEQPPAGVEVHANDTVTVSVVYACRSVEPSDQGLAQGMRDTIASAHGPQPPGPIDCTLLSQLIELYVVNAGVSDPNLAGLQYATSLDSIDLSGNRLTSLAAEAFAGQPGLRNLSLAENAFTDFPLAALGRATTLRSLDLGSNKLATVPDDAFAAMSGLEFLFLDENELTGLGAATFADNPGLRHLDLSSNRLTTLEAATFSGLGALAHLELDKNLIVELPSDAFGDLGALTELYLGQNSIASLPGGTLVGLPSLEVLSLEHNDVTSLTPDSFADLTSLRFLDLGRNGLTELAFEWFSPLTALDDLRLASNCLAVTTEPTATVLAQLALVVGSIDVRNNPATTCVTPTAHPDPAAASAAV